MTNKQLNLESVNGIKGIEFVTDHQAECISAGAFTYGTSPNDEDLHFTSGNSAELRSDALANGAPLRIINDSFGEFVGEDFFDIEYFTEDGRLLSSDSVVHSASGFSVNLDPAPRGAAIARITQGV